MEKFSLQNSNIKFLSDDEISEMVFKKLIDRDKFSLLFLDIRMFCRFLFDKDFRTYLPSNTILVPSSRVVSFVLVKVLKLKSGEYLKESSCIFKTLRAISDYPYRILVVESSDKVVSRFKKNIMASLRDASFNIIGIYSIFYGKSKLQKIETIKKIEPDIAIVGDNVVKFIKLMSRNKDMLRNASFIFSLNGVKVIAGVGGLKRVFGKVISFFEFFVVFGWFVYKILSDLFRR